MKKCLTCNKEFSKGYNVSIKSWEKTKYCSKICAKYTLFKKYSTPWNKGLKFDYIPHPGQIGKTANEKNPKWKGDKVGYEALHSWISRKLKRPIECVYCGDNGRLEWASISHKARRDLEDYISLCVKCHRKYDNDFRKEVNFEFTSIR